MSGLHSTVDTQIHLTGVERRDAAPRRTSADVQGANVVRRDWLRCESTAVCGSSAQTVDLLLTRPGGRSISYSLGAGAEPRPLYRRTCAGGAADEFAVAS